MYTKYLAQRAKFGSRAKVWTALLCRDLVLYDYYSKYHIFIIKCM